MNLSFKPKSPWLSAVLLLVLSCGLTSPALAQHYQIKTYQEWDGLPTNTVFDAAQDSLGRMWFSTRVGLVSFDGDNWEIQAFHPNASAQVQAKLKTDSHGCLWTVTSRLPLRLSRLVNGKWETRFFRNPPFQNFTVVGLEVFEDDQDGLWVTVSTYDGDIIIWDGESWSTLAKGDELGSVLDTEILGSWVYFATTSGLFKMNLLEMPFQVLPVEGLPPGPVNNLARIPQTPFLWLVGSDWLGRWDGNTLSHGADHLQLIDPPLGAGVSAVTDGAGGFFFGGLRSIYYFHPELGLEILSHDNGLTASGATSFFGDREGNTWITSTRGISKMSSRRFAGYNHESGLLVNEVSAILELQDGRIVFGHEGGLSFLDQKIQTFPFNLPNSPQPRVMDLLEDKQGNLWFAADRGGLGRLAPDGTLKWFSENEGLAGAAFSLHLDNEGTLWIGTLDGLFQFDGKRFKMIVLPSVLNKTHPLVRRLVPGPGNSFFVATAHQGAYRWESGFFSQYLPAQGPGGGNTYTCFPRPDHELWVGSATGLFKVVNEKLVRTSEPDPVIDRPVYSMLEDRHGQVWFGTDLGVMRWDGNQLDHLTVQNGLLGNETNRDALIQSANGDIWIGTDSGASRYRGTFDLDPIGSPNIQITGFRVDGREFPADKKLDLSNPPQTLEIIYQGFSFVAEDRLRFRTRLLNFEDEWHEAKETGATRLNYINVPPGEYQFQVQAIRLDGVGSKIVTSPLVIIKPPLFDRWFIRIVMVLVGIGLVWIVFALISERRYSKRLEAESYQQTWELRLSEQSIKAESRRLAATLKNISDGVLAVSFDGTIVLANAAAEKILGLSQPEIIGSPLDSILFLDSSESGPSLLCIAHPRRKDRTLEISTSPITDPEQSDGFSDHGRVVAFRDISDRLHQEEERIRTQKLESLGVFAGGLAHDFNNLLTVMLGNLSILEASTQIPETEMQMLSLVREASTRAQNLTRQLLTFARGGTPLLETASISKIVRQSVEFSLSGTNVSFELDLPENLWPVEVDPGQVDQVLANLVLNSVQAMPQGGTIKVSGHNIGSQERRHVMVEIQDEGTGILEEDLVRIFDPYFTTKDLGSGLGLAICYSIINRHGGHITVDSEVGKGSVFRIFLKAKSENERKV